VKRDLSIQEILALNPQLDAEKVLEIMKFIAAMSEGKSRGTGYRLASPFTRRRVSGVDVEERDAILLTKRTG